MPLLFFLQICFIRDSNKWFFFRKTYPQNMHVVEMSIYKIYRCLLRCGSILSFTQILIKLVGRQDIRDNRKCSIHQEVLSRFWNFHHDEISYTYVMDLRSVRKIWWILYDIISYFFNVIKCWICVLTLSYESFLQNCALCLFFANEMS